MSITYEAALLATESSALIEVIPVSATLANTPRAGLPVDIPRDQLGHWLVTWPLGGGAGTASEVGGSIELETEPTSPHADPNHLARLVRELQAYDEALSFTTDPDEREEILSQRSAAEEELKRLAPASIEAVDLGAVSGTVQDSTMECDPQSHDWRVVVSVSGPQVIMCRRCNKELGVESDAAFETGSQINEICARHGHDWRVTFDELAQPTGVACHRCLEERELAARNPR